MECIIFANLYGRIHCNTFIIQYWNKVASGNTNRIILVKNKTASRKMNKGSGGIFRITPFIQMIKGVTDFHLQCANFTRIRFIGMFAQICI